jgi:hypothetical protein
MKFKLTLEAKPSKYPIEFGDKLMLIGSCFTENIGAKFKSHLFEISENPYGILFNPVSVTNTLTEIMDLRKYKSDDLFQHNELWHSWSHHSRFSAIEKEVALENINRTILDAHHFLKSANRLVITLGSAWLYHLTNEAPLGKGQVVANNHKGPINWFFKSLMQPNELLESLQALVARLQTFNPNLQIVFTISPVRHLREGLIENNRSKAVLIHAVHELVSQSNQVDYFPAYEYVMDDLRDYRFYAEDLVHPNFAASGYVWDKLVETYMDHKTQAIMKQIAELQLAMNHKPFFTGSVEHQKFLQSCILKTETLIAAHPTLSLQDHLAFFKAGISK